MTSMEEMDSWIFCSYFDAETTTVLSSWAVFNQEKIDGDVFLPSSLTCLSIFSYPTEEMNRSYSPFGSSSRYVPLLSENVPCLSLDPDVHIGRGSEFCSSRIFPVMTETCAIPRNGRNKKERRNI